MIKKCNDFGAGGVSVAIGELADGLDINLDPYPQNMKGWMVLNLPFPSPRREWQL